MVDWKWERTYKTICTEEPTYGFNEYIPVVQKQEAEERLAKKDALIARLNKCTHHGIGLPDCPICDPAAKTD